MDHLAPSFVRAMCAELELLGAANIYGAVAHTIRGDTVAFADDFPTVQDGAHGVRFIAKALESQAAGAWVDATYTPPGASR